MPLFAELKRRNVFKVGIAYIVAAWLVMQVADIILNNVEAPGWVFHVLLLFLSIGFLFALFFAWAYELTPEGLKREHEVDRSQSITHVTGRKLDFIIIGILAVALGYFAWDKFVLGPGREAAGAEAIAQAQRAQLTEADSEDATQTGADDQSIAVLPFVNMSSDQEQEYFSDGLSEELLNLLASIPQLRVTSRSSAFSYKGKDFKIADVGRELDVAHVLEGSVRKSGRQVRITAQLIRVDGDVHLWSETYDRTLEDIFAIQDEIASRVVDQLKVKLLGAAPRVAETDPEAYALFLQAVHLGRQGSTNELEQSALLFNQALEIDPDYASAWSGLAVNYSNQAVYRMLPKDEAFRLSEEAALAALAIDPEHAKAYSSLANIAMYRDDDLAAAAGFYEKALALAPTDDKILGNAANLAYNLGRFEQAAEIEDFTIARDPVNPTAYFNHGSTLMALGRWDQAIEAYESALRMAPDRAGAHVSIGFALLFKGELEAALEAMQREPWEPYRLLGEAMAYHDLGRTDESDAALRKAIEQYGEEMGEYVAAVRAWRGEVKQAFDLLDAQYEAEGSLNPEIVADVMFARMHADHRWSGLVERLGKSEALLAQIPFRVSLPEN